MRIPMATLSLTGGTLLGIWVALSGVAHAAAPSDQETTSSFNAVVGSRISGCAVIAGRDLRCWGANWMGQLGDGTTVGSAVALPVVGLPPQAKIIALESENSEVCAVLNDGTLWCWGARAAPGTIGVKANPGGAKQRKVPFQVTGLAMSGTATCVRSRTGQLACWLGESPQSTPKGWPQVHDLRSRGRNGFVSLSRVSGKWEQWSSYTHGLVERKVVQLRPTVYRRGGQKVTLNCGDLTGGRCSVSQTPLGLAKLQWGRGTTCALDPAKNLVCAQSSSGTKDRYFRPFFLGAWKTPLAAFSMRAGCVLTAGVEKRVHCLNHGHVQWGGAPAAPGKLTKRAQEGPTDAFAVFSKLKGPLSADEAVWGRNARPEYGQLLVYEGRFDAAWANGIETMFSLRSLLRAHQCSRAVDWTLSLVARGHQREVVDWTRDLAKPCLGELSSEDMTRLGRLALNDEWNNLFKPYKLVLTPDASSFDNLVTGMDRVVAEATAGRQAVAEKMALHIVQTAKKEHLRSEKRISMYLTPEDVLACYLPRSERRSIWRRNIQSVGKEESEPFIRDGAIAGYLLQLLEYCPKTAGPFAASRVPRVDISGHCPHCMSSEAMYFAELAALLAENGHWSALKKIPKQLTTGKWRTPKLVAATLRAPRRGKNAKLHLHESAHAADVLASLGQCRRALGLLKLHRRNLQRRSPGQDKHLYRGWRSTYRSHFDRWTPECLSRLALDSSQQLEDRVHAWNYKGKFDRAIRLIANVSHKRAQTMLKTVAKRWAIAGSQRSKELSAALRAFFKRSFVR